MSDFQYSPSAEFHAAASYLSRASSLSRLSNTVKLELYGLFKLLTVSSKPNTTRPSILDITGRAKWDAWHKAGLDYDGRSAQAETVYLDIARDLGWTQDAVLSVSSERHTLTATDSDDSGLPADLFDEDSGGRRGRGGGGGSGMGVVVSAVARPESQYESDGTLHGFAVSNDVGGLFGFLASHPSIDLDGLDDFGYTALHLACDRGNLEIVKLLTSNGASLHIKDPDEFTAIDLARVANQDEIVSLLETT